MKMVTDDDATLIIKALDHYADFLRATGRDDRPYREIIAKLQQPELERKAPGVRCRGSRSGAPEHKAREPQHEQCKASWLGDIREREKSTGADRNDLVILQDLDFIAGEVICVVCEVVIVRDPFVLEVEYRCFDATGGGRRREREVQPDTWLEQVHQQESEREGNQARKNEPS